MFEQYLGEIPGVGIGSEKSGGFTNDDSFACTRWVVGVMSDIELFVCWFDVCFCG